ncbi:MAG: peptidase C11, partial [Oscillospiraceae bacterium]|nr:peptidase C11 [Oscillospiraceae bacterium]
MERNNRPHSRKTSYGKGSVKVGKTGRAGVSGPVGSGGRGESGSGGGRSAQRSGGGSLLSLLAIFFALPKKLRRIVLIAVVLIGGFLFITGGLGGSESAQLPADVPEFDINSVGVAPTAAPAPTQTPVQSSVSGVGREKRVVPLGGGKDTVTIMVYMCGTDLESKYGMGTSDLAEMTKAQISDKVNLIVETGGCKKWKNNIVSSSVNEIYKIETGGLQRLVSDAGNAAMTDPDNLTAFIDFCQENYPADRNILIFWDHGGGSISGYGYDEKKSSSDTMTLAEIRSALQKADCVFDWIGFDACLMATLETALVCNEYADYLIASEETEPGTGWDYTGWLTELSANTSLPTVDTAETLIDDFVSASCAASSRAQVTLSVIDLAEMEGSVPATFNSFAESTTALLESSQYKQVSNARSGVRQFAQSSRINQIDLIDLCDRMDTAESRALADALRSCVKYNKSTISRAYGVSIYFPYESMSSMNSAVSTYESIGLDAAYTECIKSFASLGQAGQLAGSASQSADYFSGMGGSDLLGSLLGAYSSGASASPLGSLLGGSTAGIDPSTLMGLMSAFSGRSMPQELSWMDTDLVSRQAETIAANFLDPARITATWKNGRQVLTLSDEEWELIDSVELNVYVNDGQGFIDLGLDNRFDFDDDGDLLLSYDNTWLTVNGQPVAYYLVSDTENDDGSWTTVGRIPAMLNGEPVNLQVVFE